MKDRRKIQQRLSNYK